MASRPCLVCGAPSQGSRCAAHGTGRRRPSATARGLGRQHQRAAKVLIEAWVTSYGWVCPGWDRPAHQVAPGELTLDHVQPRTVRPDLANEPSNHAVLCGPCNSHKSAKAPELG